MLCIQQIVFKGNIWIFWYMSHATHRTQCLANKIPNRDMCHRIQRSCEKKNEKRIIYLRYSRRYKLQAMKWIVCSYRLARRARKPFVHPFLCFFAFLFCLDCFALVCCCSVMKTNIIFIRFSKLMFILLELQITFNIFHSHEMEICEPNNNNIPNEWTLTHKTEQHQEW